MQLRIKNIETYLHRTLPFREQFFLLSLFFTRRPRNAYQKPARNPFLRSKPSRRGLRSRRTAVQKPHGELTPRVRLVGPEKFAVVCCDPAKHRTEWLMADFYGQLLVPPQTVEHNRPQLAAAVATVRRTIEQRGIGDIIVCIERTGNFPMPVKRAFAAAGFETRLVHPFAV